MTQLNTDMDDLSDVTDEAKAWQEDANLPFRPTAFTLPFRKAVSGYGGPREADWLDKPHRLVWDLCLHIEEQSAILAGMEMGRGDG